MAWKDRAESLLRQCQGAPACMAFLLDRLAAAVAAGVPVLDAGGQQQQQPQQPAAGAGAGAGAGQQQQQRQRGLPSDAADGGGAGASAPLPHALASWLLGRAEDLMFDEGFAGEAAPAEPGAEAAAAARWGCAEAEAVVVGGRPLALVPGCEQLAPKLWLNLDGTAANFVLNVRWERRGWDG